MGSELQNGEKKVPKPQNMQDDRIWPPAGVVRGFIHFECNSVSLVPGNVRSSPSTHCFGQVVCMAEP